MILLPSVSHDVFSDASGTFGCGAVLDAVRYFKLEWHQGVADMYISVKELVPITIACVLWGPEWTGRHIRFHSDNMAVVSIVSSRSAKSEEFMHALRCIKFSVSFTSLGCHLYMSQVQLMLQLMLCPETI